MSAKTTQPSLAPTAKVGSSAAAGAAVIVLVWVAGLFGLAVPPEVASAVSVLIMAGVAYIVKERALPPSRAPAEEGNPS